jgi:hypothetical protein
MKAHLINGPRDGQILEISRAANAIIIPVVNVRECQFIDINDEMPTPLRRIDLIYKIDPNDRCKNSLLNYLYEGEHEFKL